KARALAVAKEIGLDMARLEKDMASEEIKTTIAETFTIAEAMGLNGTPSYVIGNEVVIGAVRLPSLKEKVSMARCRRPTCCAALAARGPSIIGRPPFAHVFAGETAIRLTGPTLSIHAEP